MQRVKQKLHSQTGASFLLALLAFLVASMVSVTIVMAAVTSVKRIYNDQEEQQAHLTLTSAAQLVREEMENTKYKKEVIVSVEESTTIDSVTTNIKAEGTFAEEIKVAVNHVNTYGSQYVSTADTAIKIETTGIETELVDVTFVMKAEEGEKYKIIFTFSLDNSKETLFLTMTGSSKTNNYGEGDTTTTTTEITWSNGIINGLGG